MCSTYATYGQVRRAHRVAVALPVLALLAACDAPASTEVMPAIPPEVRADHQPAAGTGAGPHAFAPPVFDIAAAPDGGILVAQFATIHAVDRNGVRELLTVPTVAGSAVNGLSATGTGSFFAASAGLDLAVGAGLWHVSNGRAELVGDIEAFETAHDPDALEGPRWKDLPCEAAAGFSAGPQSNPYHLTTLSGSRALVADAAGNTLLSGSKNGDVDWIALLTPPVDGSDEYLVTFELADGTDCNVQPVPTAADVGPDGAYYVGELTGVTATELSGGVATGLSRVWRIEPGSRHVVCSEKPADASSDCQVAISGLTSIIDLEFAADGTLYVLEYDANGWFSALGGNPAGGRIQACDVQAGTCAVHTDGLDFPGAIAFDKWGHLWLLESNIFSPTVTRLD